MTNDAHSKDEPSKAGRRGQETANEAFYRLGLDLLRHLHKDHAMQGFSHSGPHVSYPGRHFLNRLAASILWFTQPRESAAGEGVFSAALKTDGDSPYEAKATYNWG